MTPSSIATTSSRETPTPKLPLSKEAIWEGRKAIILASRGKIDLEEVLKELSSKNVGSYVVRDSRKQPNIKEFCYVVATGAMQRISVKKQNDLFCIYKPESFKTKQFAHLEDILRDPDIAKLLFTPLKLTQSHPSLPKAYFQNPARMTIIPFFRVNQEKLQQAYEQFKAKLKGNPFLQVDFDDATKQITFSHYEKEIDTILRIEELRSHICGSFTLTRIDLTMYGASVYWLGGNSRNDYLEKEEKLQAEATAFFAKQKATVVNVNPNLTVATLIPHLLKKHQGFCVGERHGQIAPVKFLIDNMQEFKKQNVKTLFLEHLFYDSTQKWLDTYLAMPPGTSMPLYLEAYLQNLASGHLNRNPDYNYVKLVEAAKDAKIRVVAIDTTVSYLSGSHDKLGIDDDATRYKAMNYVAAKIIAYEKGSNKFVAFMGSAHVGTVAGQIGVCDVLGCPSVVIEDKKKEALPELQVNVKNLHEKIKHVSVYMQL